MADFVFGKSLDYRFLPIANAEGISAYSLVSARTYEDYPSEAQRANTGTGHLDEQTTWTALPVNEYQITFDAITDADPYSNNDYESYYVVVNYRLESGGDILSDVETIAVYRPDSFTDKIETVPSDVYKLERRLEDLLNNQIEMEDYISAAIEDIKAKIEARGYSLRKIFNWKKLNLSCERLACAYACNSLSGDGSEFWARKAAYWQNSFELMFNSAMIFYDTSGKDDPTQEMKEQGGAVYLCR